MGFLSNIDSDFNDVVSERQSLYEAAQCVTMN